MVEVVQASQIGTKVVDEFTQVAQSLMTVEQLEQPVAEVLSQKVQSVHVTHVVLTVASQVAQPAAVAFVSQVPLERLMKLAIKQKMTNNLEFI